MRLRILASINNSLYCRAYFGNANRFPMYGKFVRLNDFEEAWAKGMVRFISESRMKNFLLAQSDYAKSNETRLYKIDDFSFVNLLNQTESNTIKL